MLRTQMEERNSPGSTKPVSRLLSLSDFEEDGVHSIQHQATLQLKEGSQLIFLPKRPNSSWRIPRLHMDFTGPFKSTHYLVLVDVLSKWREMIPVNPATFPGTIMAPRRLLTQYRLSDQIMSVNGSQFASALFRNFWHRNPV